MSFDLDEFGFDAEKWEEVSKEDQQKKEVEMSEYDVDSPTRSAYGYNVALPAFEWKGKSLLATLIGFLNTEYFDMFDVQENYPNVYRLIKEGYIPEVEEIRVLDLDASYENLSHSGIFYDLVKPLYKDEKIKRKTIKVKRRQQRLINNDIREVALLDIDKTKAQIENYITMATRDYGPEVAFLIDSMSSYDELLNDKFRILYENVIAEEDKRALGSSLKGIKQSFWTIRNGWWLETLRDKRSYKGWQIDTYKISPKSDIWLEKEIETAKKSGKDVDDIVDYTIQWAPRTEFELDFIMQINNDGDNYWVDVRNRFQGNTQGVTDRCYYTKEKRRAWFEILDKLAPYLMSEKEDKELW
jgi:hypothetical protein